MVAAVNVKYSVALEDTDKAACDERQRELDALINFMADFGTVHASFQPTLTRDSAYMARTYDSFVAEALRQQRYAMEKGVRLSLEPHIQSSVCTNAAIHRLKAEHPEFLFTYDPSHLLYSGEDIHTTEYLMAGTAMVHLRDARKGELFVPYGQGGLDLPFVISALQRSGYQGPIALEYLSDRRDDAIYEDLFAFRAAIQVCLNDLT
jgi:sugar phosphate isomerase/epimerase